MNFLGLEDSRNRPENAVWFLPVPYEATVSFGRGTSFGPAALISASASIEEYDAETGTDLSVRPGIYTAPPLAPDLSGPKETLLAIEEAARRIYQPGRLVIGLGGEHSITLPLVRAAAGGPDKPLVLYLDAHADLRPEYGGTPYSHACTARRLLEAGFSVLEMGVRSLSREDVQALGSEGLQVVYGRDLASGGLSQALELLRQAASGRLLYLSLDMDFFDASLVPAVGTPEPGGPGWWEFTAIVNVALGACKRLVGADVVELTGPLCDWRMGSCVTAAKAAYHAAIQALARNALGAQSGQKHRKGGKGAQR